MKKYLKFISKNFSIRKKGARKNDDALVIIFNNEKKYIKNNLKAIKLNFFLILLINY